MTFNEQDVRTAGFILIFALNIASTGLGIIAAGFGGGLVGFALPWILLGILTMGVSRRERKAEKP